MENETDKKGTRIFYGIIILVIIFVGYKFISEFTLEQSIDDVDKPIDLNITPEPTKINVTASNVTQINETNKTS